MDYDRVLYRNQFRLERSRDILAYLLLRLFGRSFSLGNQVDSRSKRGLAMKPYERDELLIRLDERTNNIWNLTEQQEKHLAQINNHLADHSNRITIVETVQKERNRPNKKTLAGYITGATGLIAALWKAYFAG